MTDKPKDVYNATLTTLDALHDAIAERPAEEWLTPAQEFHLYSSLRQVADALATQYMGSRGRAGARRWVQQLERELAERRRNE